MYYQKPESYSLMIGFYYQFQDLFLIHLNHLQ